MLKWVAKLVDQMLTLAKELCRYFILIWTKVQFEPETKQALKNEKFNLFRFIIFLIVYNHGLN